MEMNVCSAFFFPAVHVIKVISSCKESISSISVLNQSLSLKLHVFFCLFFFKHSAAEWGLETQHFKVERVKEAFMKRHQRERGHTEDREEKMCVACGEPIKPNNQAHNDKSV